MSKKLFVGNLAYSTTQQTLQDLFAEFGEIEEAVVVIAGAPGDGAAERAGDPGHLIGGDLRVG